MDSINIKLSNIDFLKKELEKFIPLDTDIEKKKIILFGNSI